MIKLIQDIFYSRRLVYFLGFLTCVGLMLFALFLEHYKNLEPCPLCIAQRICVILFAIFCLIGGFTGPAKFGRRIIATFTGIIAITGIVLASRQLYLQSLSPDEVAKLGECLPSLSMAFQMLPFTELVTTIFNGTGDCAKVQWSWLGLTIPGWCLVAFIGMLSFSLWQFFRNERVY
jgi:disulfide bond formation protein DsbB